MKLADALKIVQSAEPQGSETSIFLACGFLPLHLATFLQAHLTRALPRRHVKVETGLYGDMAGNLKRLKNAKADFGITVFEWADFDPRLGLRSLGGWSPAVLNDIVVDAEHRAGAFAGLISDASPTLPITVSLPTLPLPPISYQRPEQLSQCEIQLNSLINEFSIRLASAPNVRILNRQRLDMSSSPSDRLDVKAELSSGFPYRLAHASKLAEMLSQLIASPAPKKGLITDLDDTLWRGLVGEEGVANVSWDLDQQSQIHALYQQVLLALAESGVLLGVASKNDEDLALQALKRDDLIIGSKHFFPLEINWRAKSQSVSRILDVWNIGADSVVFVDDSAHDIAEVKAAFPEMECLKFPAGDDHAAYEFLLKLRGLFGKETLTEDDAVRSQSIRNATNYRTSLAKGDPEEFLAQLNAELIIDLPGDDADGRAVELINKTNQFNLNGRRLNTVEFQSKLRRPDSFMLVLSYKDKYGPLGKVAVILGTASSQAVTIETWVMSCRAFSRRIEHASLEYLFEKFGAAKIVFEFESTERNRPVQEFLAGVLGREPQPGSELEKHRFAESKPPLHQTIKDLVHA